MAITLYAQPDVVCSANSDIVFDVVTDSTDITTVIKATLFYKTSQDKFYRIGGRKSNAKRSGYNYHRFNFTGLVSKLLSHDHRSTTLTQLYTDCEGSSIEFFVKFTEYYPIPTPTVHASTSSGLFYANNTNILKTETQGTYTGSDWYMDGVASHKFLTNSPSTLYVRENEGVQLGFLTSYTDPIVKVARVQANGSTTTTTYQIGNQTYEKKLWDWSVDEDNVVTIETPELYSETAYIDNRTAFPSADYKYMPDSTNVMWGGIQLIADDSLVEIVLPTYTGTPDVSFYTYAKTTDAVWEIYYFHTGVWNLSAGAPFTTLAGTFATTTETLPANTTKVRIKKIAATGTQELWIPYAYISLIDNNAQNKRCQFTLEGGSLGLPVVYADVYVENGSGGIISETKRFVVDRDYVENTSRFAFKNLRGDFDHYTFKQGHQESLTVEKVITQKELPIGFTKADRQSQVAFVTSDIIFTSWTEYEENATLTWLKELVESKEVFLEVGTDSYAVDILTSGVRTSHHSEPLQFEITWAFSAKRNV